MLLDARGVPMGKTTLEDEEKARKDHLLAILTEVTAVLEKHKVDRPLGEQVVANMVLHMFMGLPPGFEQKWANYYVEMLLKMLNNALPHKLDQNAVQQGVAAFMQDQAAGRQP